SSGHTTRTTRRAAGIVLTNQNAATSAASPTTSAGVSAAPMTPRPNGVPNSNKAISTTLSGGPDAEGLPLTIPSSHGPATLTSVTALAARATPHTIPGLLTTASVP